MIREFTLGAVAALSLSPIALAQPTESTGSGPGGAPAGTTTTDTAPGTSTGVPGLTQPGVAGGVQPYRPAGAPTGNPSAAGLPPSLAPSPAVPGPTSGSSLAGSINTSLQAGQVPGGDSTTVGSASAAPGLRTPNSSTGVYNGQAGSSYGAPAAATPYTGPGAAAVPPGAAPYAGPGASAPTAPSGGAPGR